MTEEQIQQYIHIPQTVVEQEKNDELEKIKKDIAYLLKEVEELKVGRRSSEVNKPDTGRGGSLTSMDRMHEEKRRMREEQLLKDHPNFKQSKRLKDSLTELQREPKME
jgi:exopolyphosphatase/pppGpp-phosphohydrolase